MVLGYLVESGVWGKMSEKGRKARRASNVREVALCIMARAPFLREAKNAKEDWGETTGLEEGEGFLYGHKSPSMKPSGMIANDSLSEISFLSSISRGPQQFRT
jgi:hypothetical protein